MILLTYLKINMDWIKYISNLSQDKRLNVWHLALITALIQLAVEQKSEKKIRVSRSLLMKKSLINTIPTFHKYFKQLQIFGYIKYLPSYHPDLRSTVELTFKQL